MSMMPAKPASYPVAEGDRRLDDLFPAMNVMAGRFCPSAADAQNLAIETISRGKMEFAKLAEGEEELGLFLFKIMRQLYCGESFK